jgi:predicted metal-binding membrane protein
MLERLLAQDRKVVLISLILVSLIAWGWLLAGAGMGMDGIEMTRHSMMGMNTVSATDWTLPYALLMFSMWWIMMIAMMLPSASAVILLAAGINRRSRPEARPYGTTLAFTSGYLLTWGVFSILAVLAQWALSQSGQINTVMQSNSDLLSAALLITAGVWQFTPWKSSCLRQCRGPVDFLTRNRKTGNSGALLMGSHHGLYCLGCCWFLMALLFVGGVMNLFWIAGLAIYVWVEKMLPGGQNIARIMGVVLMTAGVWMLVNYS